jgi:hypothetical protein
MRFAKRQNDPQGASSSGIAQSAETEKPAANIDPADRGADTVCGPNDLTPITTAPAALQERIGRPPGDGEAVPKSRHAPANDAVASDKRVEGALDGSPRCRRRNGLSLSRLRLIAGRRIEEPAAEADEDDGLPLHDQCVNLEIAGSETADAVVHNGDDAAALDGADGEQGRTDTMIEPGGMATAGETNEPSETPDPEEREDVGQEVAQACQHGAEQVVTPIELQICPNTDPYSDKEPLWARGGLQLAALIASTLPQIPHKDRIIGPVLQSIDALAPALLETPIPGEQRGKPISLLRYCGYNDFADQLVACFTKADAAIAQAQMEMFPQGSSATAPGSEENPRTAGAG